MKKVIAGLLTMVFVVGMLSGCGGAVNTESKLQTSTPRPTPTPQPVPEVAADIYSRYERAIRENNLDVTLQSDITVDKDVKSGGYWVFTIGKEGDSGKKEAAEVTCALEEETRIQNIHVYFNLDRDVPLLKSIITASFLAMDESLDKAAAQEKMQKLVNSFSNKSKFSFSDVVECGEYYFFINNFTLNGFYMVNKNEIWDNDINKEEYQPVDYAMYQAPDMNDGTKFQLRGTVQSWEYNNNSRGLVFADVLGEDGNLYRCCYQYHYTPIKLQKGEKCQLYGILSKEEPAIWIVYREKLN